MSYGVSSIDEKKNSNKVRLLTDLRKLNTLVNRRPYPLPKIHDLLRRLEGVYWVSALDLAMGYYAMHLDEASQDICQLVFPWGTYFYKRLPMGFIGASDDFQEMMDFLVGHLESVSAYLDDALNATKFTRDQATTFSMHLRQLDTLISILSRAGLRANIAKCTFCRSSVDYLGFRISRKGIAPQKKKVQAILKIQPPTNVRAVRRFLGLLQLYKNMQRHRSTILAPLTELTSTKNKRFLWTSACQQAFTSIKAEIAKRTMLTYPNYRLPFDIFTDASDYQLGSVIMQSGQPLAFYSRKLTHSQRNYGVGEKELLSIVETLREFRDMLLGQTIYIYTDHRNLTFNSSTQRVIRWRLLVEEYGPTFRYIPGKSNVLADALSRLETTNNEASIPDPPTVQFAHIYAATSAEPVPIDFSTLRQHQLADPTILNLYPNRTTKIFANTPLSVDEHKKIIVPTKLQNPLLQFYHDMIIPTDITVDWQAIRNHRIQRIQRDNQRENRTRVHHTYNVGDYVYLRNDNERRPVHARTNFGPYRIVEVRNNGTLVIRKSSNYLETVHIRRVSPAPSPD